MDEGSYPTPIELEFGRRLGELERQSKPHAASLRFDPKRREFHLLLATGNTLTFPAEALSEIADATDDQYREGRLLPAGDILVFDSLDMDYDVAGLVMDLVAGPGWRTAMRASLAREMAATRSPAKAAAARENGKKGGRPRKNREAS